MHRVEPAAHLGLVALAATAHRARGGWEGCLSILTVWVFWWIWLAGYMTSAALSSLGLALGVVCVAFFCSRRRLSFYILFELSLLPTLAMVVLYGYQPEKLRAGGHLLLYTALRSLPLLLTLIGLPPRFAA